MVGARESGRLVVKDIARVSLWSATARSWSVAVASICGRVEGLTSRSNKPRRPGKVWSLFGLSSDEVVVMKV